MLTLTPQTVATIKATIPFLQENGTNLTKHFYKRLFAGNPEVTEYFNTSNQESGIQQQALGGAICAFAQNIETPENLASAISKISNKHASLGIQPEHYPIVGEHLLGSIDDLLNPAPPEILAAWAEAYGFLAEVMIAAEKDLYTQQTKPDGGWNGFRKMEVFKREQESACITSFYLRPCDPCPVIPFKSGQYLTVRIPTTEGSTTMRNYSLSGSPAWNHYRISVKQELSRSTYIPEGYVSNYLHKKIAVGDVLEIGPPCGDFFLQDNDPESPILLLSGGVGITPLLSMLHSIKKQPTTFIHAAINSANHALRHEVEQLCETYTNINCHFRYSSPLEKDIQNANHHSSGLITTEFLSQFITPETHIYFCGPRPMMQNIYKALETLEHPQELIHFEFFGPQEELTS